MKSYKDFELALPTWLINEWLPLGHKVMDTAPEGSFKTKLGIWIAVCVAAGVPVFGRDVCQGPAVIIDEETPETSLDNDINRFCQGIGVKFNRNFPLYRFSMTGFRFGVKSCMTDILNIVRLIRPVYIRMDSLIAMLPTGKNGITENTSYIGEIIRDDLNTILKAGNNNCTILLAAHSKKMVGTMTLHEVEEKDMQVMVRGHSSIVGEGCDTGLAIHKETKYPDPTRFSVITKPRRLGIPASRKPMLVELQEETYAGNGWARLIQVDNSLIPPTKNAISLYKFFDQQAAGGGYIVHTSETIVRKNAFMSKSEIKEAMNDLFHNKVILNGPRPQQYVMNPDESQIEKYYLDILKTTKVI